MGESKHTPGPWIYYADLPSTDPNWHIVTTTNKMRVLANVHIEPGNEMDEANARLIAAAPELYDALADTLRILEAVKLSAGLGPKQVARMDVAKAALAKAGA